ncbi:OmpA family protein [Sulfurovum sp.]|uniref:OmpA family protein n=1 Tax=Sulfurovum sp. TaxID=1969726 RepID=UPI0025F12FDB|nr:OmpA family protein [Sulfurovum sp.]
MRIITLILLLVSSLVASDLITGQSIKFQRGDKVLYQNDYGKCPVGELPSDFGKIVGGFECVKFDNHMFVAKTAGDHSYLIKNIKLEGDFAIEFDALIHSEDNFFVKLVHKDKNEYKELQTKPYSIHVGPYSSFYQIDVDGYGILKKGHFKKNQIFHIAMQVRRGLFRVYLNGKRLLSVPFNNKGSIDGVKFHYWRSGKAYGVLFSNVVISSYSKKEEVPKPESFGINVKEDSTSFNLSIPEKVLFDFNKFFLKAEAKKALDSVAYFINHNSVKKIKIFGYTDNIGSKDYNLKLSIKRAMSVANYLVDCKKINKAKIEVKGLGERNPIVPNNSDEHRAKNRRVEIKLLKV